MALFEYQIIENDCVGRWATEPKIGVETAMLLSNAGRDGWELVSVVVDKKAGTLFFMKRELPVTVVYKGVGALETAGR